MTDEREWFWVAVRDGFGFAMIVADGHPDVKAFFRRNAGNEIRREESAALLNKHPKIVAARLAAQREVP